MATIVTVIGNVVEDPDMRFLPNGTAVLTLRVISNNRSFNRNSGQWEEGDSFVVNCAVWRQQADNVINTVKKGMRVIVQGQLSVRYYETKDGNRGTSLELKQAEVGVSLRFAKAQVEKVTSGSQGNPYGLNQQNYQGNNSHTSSQQSNNSFGEESHNGFSHDSAYDNEPPF